MRILEASLKSFGFILSFPFFAALFGLQENLGKFAVQVASDKLSLLSLLSLLSVLILQEPVFGQTQRLSASASPRVAPHHRHFTGPRCSRMVSRMVSLGVAWRRLSTIGTSPKIRLPKFLCSGHRLARTLEGSPFHMCLDQQVRQTEPRNHGNQEKPTKIKKLQQLEFWNDIFVSHSSIVFFSPPPASKPRSAGGGQDGGPGRPLPGRLDPSPKFSALNQNESKDVQRMPDVSMSHDLIR